MTPIQPTGLLGQIRQLVASHCPSQQPDQQLLEQFLADRDEAAFAALVQRHGSMVLAVSRGALHHQQDAEDVFQATFLVLARKAHTIRRQQSLSSWLHGVAYRLACKARTRADRQRAREQLAQEPGATSPLDDLSWRELRGILHEELQRLPDKYRAPLLLCYWEGKTRDEAAAQLGQSPGAFKKYLERARHLLRSRLLARGLAPSAALIGMLFSDNGARAAVQCSLTYTTAKAAVAFAAGTPATDVSPTVVALAEGAMRTMSRTKWGLTLLLTAVLAGVGLWTQSYLQARQAPEPDGTAVSATAPRPVQTKVTTGGLKADQERILGTWRLTKLRVEGQDAPDEWRVLMRLTFTKAGKVIMTLADESQEGKYQFAGVGKLDLSMGNNQELAPAVYKFDGDDQLTICASNDVIVAKRPTEFTGEKGTGQVLLVLQRAKPGEEKVTPQEIAKYKDVIDKAREAVAQAQSANNLRQIGIAMLTYHDAHKALPLHAIYSKDGKTPLLSWRVALLPYIDQEELYKQFKLDEPWDSPHNKKLIAKMPAMYATPSGKKGMPEKTEEGRTHYQVFTGPDTLFDGAKKMTFEDVGDGTSNTILVIEAKDPVIWTKPDDLPLPKEKNKMPGVGGLFKSGVHVLLCDTSVHFLRRDLAPDVLRALVTPNGKEEVDLEALQVKQ
jgi:RNA polymerase sigma factor (sigma-70 family)